jgi:hypothetical protein
MRSLFSIMVLFFVAVAQRPATGEPWPSKADTEEAIVEAAVATTKETGGRGVDNRRSRQRQRGCGECDAELA